MARTIAVVPDQDVKGGYKVLINYLQRGITYHSFALANQEAVKISENEPFDHLILYKEEK